MAAQRMYIPGVNERRTVDVKEIWPYSFLSQWDLSNFSHAQINKFVREETLKSDAILAGDGDRLNELLEESPLDGPGLLPAEYYDKIGDYTYESSDVDAVRLSIEPCAMTSPGSIVTFIADNGAWVEPHHWDEHTIEVGPDPEFWKLFDCYKPKPVTFMAEYYRLKLLSVEAVVVTNWIYGICNEYDDLFDRHPNKERFLKSEFLDVSNVESPGYMLVAICEAAKEFPRIT